MTVRLSGIVPPLVTPLIGDDTLDHEGLERLIEHVLEGGVSGVFILGTTGEGPLLSYRLRREMISATAKFVRGRTPILVGVSDTSFVEAVAIGRYASENGATSLVMAPPYYLPLDQSQLADYIERFATSVPLPTCVYNMPSLTKVVIDVETVRRLTQCTKVSGVKDSSGDLLYFQRLLQIARIREDWTIFMGPEELMAQSILLGGHGGVNGGANFYPKLFVDLYRAAAAGDLAETRTLQERVLQLSHRVYGVAAGSSGVIQGIKGALCCLGICRPDSPQPFKPLDELRMSELRRSLQHCGVITPATPVV